MLDRVVNPRLLDKKSAKCYFATSSPETDGYIASLGNPRFNCNVYYQGLNSFIISLKSWKETFFNSDCLTNIDKMLLT